MTRLSLFASQLWNAVSEASLGVYRGHSGWVHCVAFSQDASRLVSASEDETVKVQSPIFFSWVHYIVFKLEII